MRILLTGCAGFIGAKTAELLLEQGHQVIGIDNLNDAYDPKLKWWRLRQLQAHPSFRFVQVDISEWTPTWRVFGEHLPYDAVINLAARAGVRQSVENPWVYIATNTTGALNLLGRQAVWRTEPMHPADVKATWADITKARSLLGWEPQVSVEEGLRRSVEWYLENRDWAKEVVLP